MLLLTDDPPPRAWGLLHTLLRASVVAVGLAVEPGAAPDAEDSPNPHICSAAARRGAAAGKQLVVGRRGG